MNTFNKLLLLTFAALSIGLGSCDKEDECTLTCGTDEVLTADCTCVKINTSNEVKVTSNITPIQHGQKTNLDFDNPYSCGFRYYPNNRSRNNC
ncbi:MAG: hypothetical protein IPF52_03185 [Saprospiraceae bacterium]|nr:hypothetical protein [Saprospiraceae bacterium]